MPKWIFLAGLLRSIKEELMKTDKLGSVEKTILSMNIDSVMQTLVRLAIKEGEIHG